MYFLCGEGWAAVNGGKVSGRRSIVDHRRRVAEIESSACCRTDAHVTHEADQHDLAPFKPVQMGRQLSTSK